MKIKLKFFFYCLPNKIVIYIRPPLNVRGYSIAHRRSSQQKRNDHIVMSNTTLITLLQFVKLSFL
jgi:hypothetical protein